MLQNSVFTVHVSHVLCSWHVLRMGPCLRQCWRWRLGQLCCRNVWRWWCGSLRSRGLQRYRSKWFIWPFCELHGLRFAACTKRTNTYPRREHVLSAAVAPPVVVAEEAAAAEVVVVVDVEEAAVVAAVEVVSLSP